MSIVLTNLQAEALQLIQKGMSDQEIMKELDISIKDIRELERIAFS